MKKKKLFIVQYLNKTIRSNIWRRTTFVVLPALLALLSGNSQAHIDNCTTMRYKHDNQCIIPGTSEDGYKKARDRYASEMSDHDVDVLTNDITIFWKELTDEDEISGGEDHKDDNIDDAEATYLGTHVSCAWDHSESFCNEYKNCTCVELLFRLTTESGNPTTKKCKARMSDMNVGGTGVEFVTAHACHSAEKTAAIHILEHTRYLHQWHGFYGTTRTGNGNPAYGMDDYVDDAFDGSASYAWIENVVDFDCYDNGKDCCPISMVRGSSSSNRYYRKELETFDNSDYFGDPWGNGILSHYYGSCDPNHPNGPGPMRDHFGF